MITKELFLRDCGRYVYLKKNRPQKGEVQDEQAIFLMENSMHVKKIAKELYSEGNDLSMQGTITGKELAEKTSDILHSRNYGLYYNGAVMNSEKALFSNLEIILKTKKEIEIINFKSSTKIKTPNHIFENGYLYNIFKSFQYLKNWKLEIGYLNPEYVKDGDLDLNKLFIVEDITRRAFDNQPLINSHLSTLEEVDKSSKLPGYSLGRHCNRPYRCEFINFCKKNVKSTAVDKVDALTDDQKEHLKGQGITDVFQIPRDYKLSHEQWLEIDSILETDNKINKVWLKNFIKNLNFEGPITFLDFETIAFGIPKYNGTSPYTQLPFQYCLITRVDEVSGFEIREFISITGKDPRREFVKNLVNDLRDTQGNIIVYYKDFEERILNNLIIEFPEYKTVIEDIISRIVDLATPFKEKKYYHPAFNHRFSLKVVLPVLCPSYTYDNLIIKNGISAMRYYIRLPTIPENEQLKIIKALKEYCYVDTYGMIKIVEALISITKK